MKKIIFSITFILIISFIYLNVSYQSSTSPSLENPSQTAKQLSTDNTRSLSNEAFIQSKPQTHGGIKPKKHLTREYQIDYSGKMTFTLPSTEHGQNIHWSLQGQLLQLVEEDQKRVREIYQITLDDFSISVGTQKNSELTKGIREQILSGLEVEKNHQGIIQRLFLPRQPESIKMMETLAFLMQNSLPPDINQQDNFIHLNTPLWSTLESDYHGAYQAQYFLEKLDKTNHYLIINKKKKPLSYALEQTVSSRENTKTTISSHIDYQNNSQWHIEENHWQTIEISDAITHTMQQEKIAEHSQKFSAELKKSSNTWTQAQQNLVQGLRDTWQAQVNAEKVFDQQNNHKSHANHQMTNTKITEEAQAAHQKITELYAKIQSLQGKERIQVKNQLNRLLKDFIDQFPNHLALLENDITHFSVNESGFSWYLSALSSVSSAASQASILNVMSARQAEPRAVAASMVALALSPSPSENAYQNFSQLINTDFFGEQNTESALLTQSAMIQRMNSEQEQTIQDYVASELKKLNNAQDINIILMQLTLLGNVGTHLKLTDLESYALHKNPQIQQKGLHAIRFIDEEATKNLLFNIIGNHDSSTLRAAAINSLKFQKLNRQHLSLLNTLFLEESDNDNKKALEKLINSAKQV